MLRPSFFGQLFTQGGRCLRSGLYAGMQACTCASQSGPQGFGQLEPASADLSGPEPIRVSARARWSRKY